MNDHEDNQVADQPLPDPSTRHHREHAPGPEIHAGPHVYHLHPAGLAPLLDEVRDRVYDLWVLRSTIDLRDAQVVAFYALHTNYRLDDEEARAIVLAANPDELAQAAIECLFPQKARRTYTSWARSALLACGLKPEDIPAEDLPHVLAHLEGKDRILPASEYTEADEYMATRKGFLNFGKDGQ